MFLFMRLRHVGFPLSIIKLKETGKDEIMKVETHYDSKARLPTRSGWYFGSYLPNWNSYLSKGSLVCGFRYPVLSGSKYASNGLDSIGMLYFV